MTYQKKLIPNDGSKNNFKIKTEVFEGPLDLLLSLIEKRKLFINDIALSKVTEDYIRHIEEFGKMPIGEAAQFILIASTLLLIKSRSLLPSLPLSDEEEEGIHDLEMRLKIYRRIKRASEDIRFLFGREMIFPQSKERMLLPFFSPHPKMNLASLAKSAKNIVMSLPERENIPKAVVRKVVTMEEMIESLSKRINAGLRMTFKDFTGANKNEKVNIIISFLALLELVKRGMVAVSQDKNFSDINIETKKIGVPRYN